MNYRTFAKSVDISPKMEELLLSSYMKYYFVNNRAVYSGVACEPESIVYVTSNLNGVLPEEVVVLCKNGRMSQFATPSFYFHAHLDKADKEFYKEKFFEIFKTDFMKDFEIERYNDNSIDEYEIKRNLELEEDVLSQEQLKMILYTFFQNERLGRNVKIVLDKSGDEYNKRAREVLMNIYKYLSYDHRKRCGFLSYCDEKQSVASRISFALFDRAQVRDINDTYVDLVNSKISMIGMKTKPEIRQYVDNLVGYSEAERVQHFETLERVFEGGRLNIQEWLASATSENDWRSKDVKQLLPEWMDYVYKNGQRGGPIFEKMVGIITERLDVSAYNEYLFALLEKEKVSLYNLPEDIRKAILFTEFVKDIQMDVEGLVDYFIPEVCKDSSVGITEKMPILRAELIKLEHVNMGAEQFGKVVEGVKECLKCSLDELEIELDDDIRRERAELIAKFVNQNATFNMIYYSDLCAWEAGILHEENKSVFFENVEKSMYTMSRDIANLRQSDAMACAEKLLMRYGGNLSTEFVEDFNKRIEKAKETAFTQTVLRKRSQLFKLSAIVFQCLEAGEKGKIGITFDPQNTEGIQLEFEDAKTFLLFLLEPNPENSQILDKIHRCDRRFRTQLRGFLKCGLFRADHFKYLVNYAQENLDEELEEDLKKYYLDLPYMDKDSVKRKLGLAEVIEKTTVKETDKKEEKKRISNGLDDDLSRRDLKEGKKIPFWKK